MIIYIYTCVRNASKMAPSPEENLLLKLVQAISDGQLSPEEGADVASSVDARPWSGARLVGDGTSSVTLGGRQNRL